MDDVKALLYGKEAKTNEEAIAAGVDKELEVWKTKTPEEIIEDMKDCIRQMKEQAEKPAKPDNTDAFFRTFYPKTYEMYLKHYNTPIHPPGGYHDIILDGSI